MPTGGEVRVLGEGGVPVLLLPGGIAPVDGFFPGLVEGLLADPSCRVVLHDRPGTGTSTERGSFADAAGHLAGVVDRLGLGPVVLVGQSLGGAVALLTAVEHPEAVRGLVLLDPVPVNDVRICGRLERGFVLLRGVDVAQRIGRPFRARDTATDAGGPDVPRLGAAVHGLTRRARRLATDAVRPLPSALVVAERDPGDPSAQAHVRLAAALGADLVTWPGATHEVQNDDPERVLSIVRQVVAQVT